MRDLLASPGGAVAKHLMIKGRRVESRAKVLCPVRYGRLRASITTTGLTDGDTFVVHVGSNVEYAPFAHRSGHPAAHYLVDALSAATG